MSTFNSIFENLYYFYDKNEINNSNKKITNLYVMASHKKVLTNINFKLDNVPKFIKPKLISTLKNINKFIGDNTNSKNILYDESNKYSHIFATSMPSFRKLIGSSIPSRILIN